MNDRQTRATAELQQTMGLLGYAAPCTLDAIDKMTVAINKRVGPLMALLNDDPGRA